MQVEAVTLRGVRDRGRGGVAVVAVVLGEHTVTVTVTVVSAVVRPTVVSRAVPAVSEWPTGLSGGRPDGVDGAPDSLVYFADPLGIPVRAPGYW
jgi:hypothetical protein